MQIRATKNRVSVWPKKGELEHAADDRHKSTSIKNNMHHHQLYANMEQSMYAHVARRSNKNEETEPQTAFLPPSSSFSLLWSWKAHALRLQVHLRMPH